MSTWSSIASALVTACALGAAAHALMRKRDARSAAAWIGLILLLPAVGVALYLLLGINRVNRAATRARRGMRRYAHETGVALAAPELAPRLSPSDAHLAAIDHVLDRTQRWPLVKGNRLELLRDGDQAYPAMLESIAQAARTVALSTYIFDHDASGLRFVEALAAARKRGVEVRVLIDDAGARYSFPAVDRLLERAAVSVRRFMPVWAPWSVAYANLRNHRKILVIDGKVAYSGGMNIRESCVLAAKPAAPTRDLHFRLVGPIVTQLMDVFAEDWTFATGEVLSEAVWFPPLTPDAASPARVIADGPDLDLDGMRYALLAALSGARRSVRVMTPYFLPDESLVAALNVAALRGVVVDVVLPERGNLRLVDWAMQGELWKVAAHCRVWLAPPPFDHGKAMVVDEAWTLVGSANWDPRSLRLNFELGVACHDPLLARELAGVIDDKIAQARALTPESLARIPFPTRLRNGAARLLSPYL